MFGGGIDVPPDIDADANILNSTITRNEVEEHGGGINNEGTGTITIKNTIVAENLIFGGNPSGSPGSDVFGPFDSDGNNLIGNIDGRLFQGAGHQAAHAIVA